MLYVGVALSVGVVMFIAFSPPGTVALGTFIVLFSDLKPEYFSSPEYSVDIVWFPGFCSGTFTVADPLTSFSV